MPYIRQNCTTYLMKDVSGKVIYVGKAISLKNRVRSYFRTPLPNAKTEALVEKIYDFDTVIVGNEREALILEANLIRRYDRGFSGNPYDSLKERTFSTRGKNMQSMPFVLPISFSLQTEWKQ